MGITQAMKVLVQELKQLQRGAPRHIGELDILAVLRISGQNAGTHRMFYKFAK